MSADRYTINGSLGPLFIGVVLTSCMYGVTSVQTYIYYARNSATDKSYIKYIVFFLWILNTLRLAMVSHAAYTYLVADFTNVVAIMKPTWSMFPATVITVGVSNSVVRTVFCYRVWRFSGNKVWLATAIMLAILMSFGTNLAYAVIIGHRLPSWSSLVEYCWLLSFSYGSSMAADALICISLCILLAMRRTGHARSDSIIRKLMLYAVNTGLLSTLCAVLCLTAYLTMPNNFVFMTLYLVYPELILNALLATFNGRSSLQTRAMSAPSVQHPVFASMPARRGGARVTKDVDVVQLGLVSHSTFEESGMSVVIQTPQQNDGADKLPEFTA